MQLAHHNPGNLSELQRSIDLPPPAIRQYGEDLLDLLAQQRDLPDEEMPEPLGKPLDARQRGQVKQLKSAVKLIAGEQAVTPEILLTGKDYEMLVREAHGESIDPPLAWKGWRDQLVIAPLRALLAGEKL
jgi:ribonuclease D